MIFLKYSPGWSPWILKHVSQKKITSFFSPFTLQSQYNSIIFSGTVFSFDDEVTTLQPLFYITHWQTSYLLCTGVAHISKVLGEASPCSVGDNGFRLFRYHTWSNTTKLLTIHTSKIQNNKSCAIICTFRTLMHS